MTFRVSAATMGSAHAQSVLKVCVAPVAGGDTGAELKSSDRPAGTFRHDNETPIVRRWKLGRTVATREGTDDIL